MVRGDWNNQTGWIGKKLYGDDEYGCPICGGDGKHIGDFQYSRPLIWVSDD